MNNHAHNSNIPQSISPTHTTTTSTFDCYAAFHPTGQVELSRLPPASRPVLLRPASNSSAGHHDLLRDMSTPTNKNYQQVDGNHFTHNHSIEYNNTRNHPHLEKNDVSVNDLSDLPNNTQNNEHIYSDIQGTNVHIECQHIAQHNKALFCGDISSSSPTNHDHIHSHNDEQHDLQSNTCIYQCDHPHHIADHITFCHSFEDKKKSPIPYYNNKHGQSSTENHKIRQKVAMKEMHQSSFKYFEVFQQQRHKLHSNKHIITSTTGTLLPQNTRNKIVSSHSSIKTSTNQQFTSQNSIQIHKKTKNNPNSLDKNIQNYFFSLKKLHNSKTDGHYGEQYTGNSLQSDNHPAGRQRDRSYPHRTRESLNLSPPPNNNRIPFVLPLEPIQKADSLNLQSDLCSDANTVSSRTGLYSRGNKRKSAQTITHNPQSRPTTTPAPRPPSMILPGYQTPSLEWLLMNINHQENLLMNDEYDYDNASMFSSSTIDDDSHGVHHTDMVDINVGNLACQEIGHFNENGHNIQNNDKSTLNTTNELYSKGINPKTTDIHPHSLPHAYKYKRYVPPLDIFDPEVTAQYVIYPDGNVHYEYPIPSLLSITHPVLAQLKAQKSQKSTTIYDSPHNETFQNFQKSPPGPPIFIQIPILTVNTTIFSQDDQDCLNNQTRHENQGSSLMESPMSGLDADIENVMGAMAAGDTPFMPITTPALTPHKTLEKRTRQRNGLDIHGKLSLNDRIYDIYDENDDNDEDDSLGNENNVNERFIKFLKNNEELNNTSQSNLTRISSNSFLSSSKTSAKEDQYSQNQSNEIKSDHYINYDEYYYATRIIRYMLDNHGYDFDWNGALFQSSRYYPNNYPQFQTLIHSNDSSNDMFKNDQNYENNKNNNASTENISKVLDNRAPYGIPILNILLNGRLPQPKLLNRRLTRRKYNNQHNIIHNLNSEKNTIDNTKKVGNNTELQPQNTHNSRSKHKNAKKTE